MIDRQRRRLAPIYGLVYAGPVHFRNCISERYVVIFHCLFDRERISLEKLRRYHQTPSDVAAAIGPGCPLAVVNACKVSGRHDPPRARKARQRRNRLGDARVLYFKLKSSFGALIESDWQQRPSAASPLRASEPAARRVRRGPNIDQPPQKCGQSPRPRGSGPSPSSPHRSRSRPGRGIVGYRQRFAPRTSS